MLDANKIYILDNIIPLKYQNYLEDHIINNVPFTLNKYDSSGFKQLKYDQPIKTVEESDSKLKDKIYDRPQMNHVYAYNREIFDSEIIKVVPLFSYLQSYFDYTFNYIINRSKINLRHQVSSKFSGMFTTPHLDENPPMGDNWIMIYYINDSDGDTVLFNEKWQLGENLPFPNIDRDLTIRKTVSPKKGRVLFFNSLFYHSANCPINYPTRLVLNTVMNLTPVINE